MTTEQIALSEERLREMLTGCEGVTSGPWRFHRAPLGACNVITEAKDGDGDATIVVSSPAVLGWVSDEAIRDTHHIAACDPDTIRSLVTELLALREAVKPFAEFAADNVGADGWEGSGCQKDRIVDWFGPSEFHTLARALSHPEPMK